MFPWNVPEDTWADIWENVLSKGPFVTKNLNSEGVKQAPYWDRPRGGTAERCCAAPYRTPRVTEVSRSVNILYDVRFRSNRASKFPNFHIFPIFAYKMHKNTFYVHGLQPAVTLQNVVLEGPKGCLLPVREIPVYAQCYCTALSICTKDDSNVSFPATMCLLGVWTKCFPKLWESKPQKLKCWSHE